MWVKLLCVSALYGIVSCGSLPSDKTLGKDQNLNSPSSHTGEETPSPFYELPCLKYGGLCLQKDECPDGKLAGVNGLCPSQQEKGVECCYSVPKSDTSCNSHGGECFSKSFLCPEKLTIFKTSDCHEDEKCCILIN